MEENNREPNQNEEQAWRPLQEDVQNTPPSREPDNIQTEGWQSAPYQNSSYTNGAYSGNGYQSSGNGYQSPHNGYQSYGNDYQNYGSDRPQYDPQYNAMQPWPDNRTELEEPVKVSEWVLALVLMMIPCVNIIMMFVWAFSSTEKKSKSNFFKAYLIFYGIAVGVMVLIWLFIVILALAM